MIMGYHTIIWAPGYAESHSISYIISSTFFLSQGKEFDTKAEAIKSLAEDLWQKFKDTALENNKFVEQYGKGKKIDLNCNEFFEYICGMPALVTDTYGEAEQTGTLHSFEWSPYWSDMAMKDLDGKVVYIHESAEAIFGFALHETRPEFNFSTEVEREWNKVIA